MAECLADWSVDLKAGKMAEQTVRWLAACLVERKVGKMVVK